VVEKILPTVEGIQVEEASREETIVAPSKAPATKAAAEQMGCKVEIMATLPGGAGLTGHNTLHAKSEVGEIVAVRQGNVFGTSFHPELTGDPRIHVWWLEHVINVVSKRRQEVV
jgi:5'-phosphate synthase pdxT subunit